MITLNITIGGNLLIELDGKSAKKELKEIIEKASNTDLILTDLLEASHYTGNDWHTTELVLCEAPIIAFGAVYSEDEEIDVPIDYEKIWIYSDYVISSFAEILLKEGKVIFKKV